MPIAKFRLVWIIVVYFTGIHSVSSQTQIIGKVMDEENQAPLPYVNIGIKMKDVGTVSKDDGSFIIRIPNEFENDSLTFSRVGYYESTLPVKELTSGNVTVQLKEKTTRLDEVTVTARKPVEKKYGIRRRGVIHFTDGIFKKDDSFEIGQVIKLGSHKAQITSLNLYISSSRSDSANFRINFYRYDAVENAPRQRVVETNILQRHPIKSGWLKFDLTDYTILASGDVLAAIEFIPDDKKDTKQILYEVKLGGSSKSYFRKTSLGQWVRPPHHYCLYATVLTDKNAPDETEEEETLPVFSLKSDFSDESFNFFVRLPKEYSKKTKQSYPVVYLLDGNAYFDPVVNFVESLAKKKKLSTDPIIVGIGYENAYVMDSLRNRDYTFPEALPEDSFKLSGKGDKFYDFIKSKVITHVDSLYRTDTTNRTIMGHSLGGYFVVYALQRQLSDLPIFSNFVSASPSLYYGNHYLIKMLNNKVDTDSSQYKSTLFITIGDLESGENEQSNFLQLSEKMKTNGVNTHSKKYKNFGHMETAIASFEDGVRILFDKKSN